MLAVVAGLQVYLPQHIAGVMVAEQQPQQTKAAAAMVALLALQQFQEPNIRVAEVEVLLMLAQAPAAPVLLS